MAPSTTMACPNRDIFSSRVSCMMFVYKSPLKSIGLGTVGATAVLEAWNLATASTAAIRRLFS